MNDSLRHKSRGPLLGVLLFAAASCGEPPVDDSDVERRTVGGVETITSHSPLRDSIALGPARLEFSGDESGDGPLPVAVVGALVRADGSVLLADQGTSQLYLIGPDGVPQRTVGREGEGPGEYRSIGWISRYRGDSIAVYDTRSRRVTVLDESLEVGRTFNAEGVEGRLVRVFGPVSTGRLVADGRDFPTESGLFRRTSSVQLLGLDGVAGPVLASAPSDELIWRTDGGSVIAETVPLGRSLHVAPVGNGFWLASTDSLALTRWEPDAAGVWAPRRVATLGDPFGAVAPEAIRSYLETRIPIDPSDPALAAEVERQLSITPHTTLPAFTSLLPAQHGGVWLRRSALELDRWERFGAEGRWIGSLALRSRMELLASDAAGLVVRETLSDGRQVIRVHDAPTTH